jgi:hypothetical protein
LVDFWLQELGYEGYEHFAEDGYPLFVVGGGEVVREEGALEGGEGLLAKGTAWVETLVRERF